MDQEKQRKCEIILKLLNLGDAERNSNKAEQELAQQKAAKLMAEWAIDFADLRTGKPKEDVFVRVNVDGSEEIKVDWEGALAGAVAHAFDCQIVNYDWQFAWKMAFMGAKSDVEISVFFFKYLRRTVDAMARVNVKQAAFGTLKQAQRNYRFGMVQTLGDRLEALYRMREQFIPSDCTALMVVKKDGVSNFVKDQFPRLKKARAISLKGDIGAYRKGQTDGRSINLNRPISHTGVAPAGYIK